ncbi:alpha/beta hydrolase domain-containing protein [Actinomadura opuntiae]|uniref:alpha/beta hydrolase domain-containing protein n=1 Tax=Actinomadura sp. OS1-43 TaxID=604315 RepID=UPI00255AA844|nr:alpha/beta hydrolase domain-containing protein [Actinomadura sp. OS1-43]MDL4821100.1 alpha/beta hydrolase domain-containing protein [Actinomadura sp. OS1-43]
MPSTTPTRSKKGRLAAWTASTATMLLGAALLAAPTAASAAPPSAGQPSGTLPHITGPLPVTASSHPFGAADHEGTPENLKKIGYVEEEYLISGKANVYSWPKDGPAQVRTPGAPYTTRILVRRPAKASRFSGNVVTEMLNPSNLFDLNIGWAMMHRQLVANGDVWVGVTAKPVSIVALKKFDPKRYGSLSMANPLPLNDPRNCTNVPADSSRTTENGLAWDIFSQLGSLLRSNSRSNPVSYANQRNHTHRVQHLYGFGYSQTGGYLYNYSNGIHPLDVQRNGGRPTYDGYIVAVAGGNFAGAVPMNQCDPVPPTGDPRKQFNNVGVPILHFMSQSDYLAGIASRRPDSDKPADRYRGYEMAGAGHATPDELNYSAAPADIQKAGQPAPPMNCNEGPRSRFPSHIFFDAAIRNLDLWVRHGIRPPHASPIEVKDNAPVLDQYGNVRGGLRSPYLDVPTSTWYGNSTGASFCAIAGHEVPFTEAQLKKLYPTHGAYVRAVVKDTRALVAHRTITGADGRELINEATHADIP